MEFNNGLMQINGWSIHVNNFMCTRPERRQFRFPKRKCNRLRKKWSKQDKNYNMLPSQKAFKIDGKIYVSQFVYDKLLMYYKLEAEEERKHKLAMSFQRGKPFSWNLMIKNLNNEKENIHLGSGLNISGL